MRINTDLTALPTSLELLHSHLIDDHHQVSGRNAPHRAAADLLVARELRRTVFVVVGHRFAMALLPQVIDVLSRGNPPPVLHPEALEGARGRMFYHHQAAFVATMRALLDPARRRMFAEMTQAERITVRTEVRRLSREVSVLARRTHAEEFGDAWTGQEHVQEPYRLRDGIHRPHRSRTLTFLADHMSPELDVSLRGSELGQAEHLAVGLADLHRAFTAIGCPPEHRAGVALEHLSMLSALAALRDEIAERIVFEPAHRPLYRVDRPDPEGRWRVVALRPPMTARILERPGRCPAVVALPPVSDEHQALVDRFRTLLAELTDGHPPAHLATEEVSAADVSSAYAIALADRITP